MSLIDPGGTFEPGRTTIKARDDKGLSLTGRLGAALHFLSWRTPFHRLKLRGRHPLKLLTVPKDPVAGSKQAGEEILAGRITRGQCSADLKTIDFNDPAMDVQFSDYLQSFQWLRDLGAAATRERASNAAEHVVRRWLEQCGGQVKGRSWRADLWARRILFWSAYAPYILSTRDLVYRSAVLNALARGSRHIERGAGRASPGLQRITAWAGVIASALVLQGGPVRLGKGEEGLAGALQEDLHEDGGLVSRAPVEQLAMVETLSQLRAVYHAARRDMPEELGEALARSAAALLASTLGDGGLGNWQGGNRLSAGKVEAALQASGLEVRPLRQARGWGYQRLSAKKTVLVVDAAPPPPARTLLGGCASTLAFEMSDGTDRLIVNCGGAGEACCALPGDIAQALRTTAAHSTLTFADRNSTAVHEDGTLGKGVSEVELAREQSGGGQRLEASHDGYLRRFGLVHHRRLELASSGLELAGEDRIERRARRRRMPDPGFAVRFHLGPAVEVVSTADRQGALLRIRGGPGWQFRCAGGDLSIEDSLWIDGSGRAHATQQLVISGAVEGTEAAVSWSLKRTG